MDVKFKILSGAGDLFQKYGIRSVKMDDVAKELSMSKKTLYQYFKDKEQLVEEATRAHLEREKKEFQEIFNTSQNAIEELYKFSKCLRRNMDEVSPTLLFDLKRHYTKSWSQWLNFKENFVFVSIVKNLKSGIESGYFRKDLDPQIMAILRVMEVEMLFDADTFPLSEFDFKRVQMQLFDHFVFGIATDKGRKLYQKYLESEQHEKIVQ